MGALLQMIDLHDGLLGARDEVKLAARSRPMTGHARPWPAGQRDGDDAWLSRTSRHAAYSSREILPSRLASMPSKSCENAGKGSSSSQLSIPSRFLSAVVHWFVSDALFAAGAGDSAKAAIEATAMAMANQRFRMRGIFMASVLCVRVGAIAIRAMTPTLTRHVRPHAELVSARHSPFRLATGKGCSAI